MDLNYTLGKILNDFIRKFEGKKINGDFAEFINHYYGNIKTEKGIKQYLFFDGDDVSEVVTFLNTYYPGWEEC